MNFESLAPVVSELPKAAAFYQYKTFWFGCILCVVVLVPLYINIIKKEKKRKKEIKENE